MKHTEFEAFLKKVLDSKGELCLPNVKEILDPQEALNIINRATCKLPVESPYTFRVQNFDPPINGVQTHSIAYYPKIFLQGGGMGNRFNGSGAFLCSSNGIAKVFTFAMCAHEWNESGANHSRGWHPKRCTKCGFDASIDSGD